MISSSASALLQPIDRCVDIFTLLGSADKVFATARHLWTVNSLPLVPVQKLPVGEMSRQGGGDCCCGMIHIVLHSRHCISVNSCTAVCQPCKSFTQLQKVLQRVQLYTKPACGDNFAVAPGHLSTGNTLSAFVKRVSGAVHEIYFEHCQVLWWSKPPRDWLPQWQVELEILVEACCSWHSWGQSTFSCLEVRTEYWQLVVGKVLAGKRSVSRQSVSESRVRAHQPPCPVLSASPLLPVANSFCERRAVPKELCRS